MKTNDYKKTCRKCGEQKDAHLFTTDSRSGRFRSPCKDCALLQNYAWRNRNKERVNALAREHSKSDKSREQAAVRAKRWRRRHPELKRADGIKRRAAIKELKIQSVNESGTL